MYHTCAICEEVTTYPGRYIAGEAFLIPLAIMSVLTLAFAVYATISDDFDY